MKQYQGVVFFDYDFTTIDAEEQILTATPTTKRSLEKLQNNGYLTMLCSGRSKRFLEQDLNLFQGAITCNGAYAEADGQILRDECLKEHQVREILKRYLPERVSIQMETQNVTYSAFQHKEIYERFREFLDFPDHWFARFGRECWKEHVTKVVVYYENERVFEDFKKRYSDQFHIVKPFEGEPLFDVTLKGITKGDAIAQTLDHYEIARKDSYAFGDSDNDVEMLEMVGTGVVMAKHSVKAGQAASMVTGTVREEGITQGLEKLGLI